MCMYVKFNFKFKFNTFLQSANILQARSRRCSNIRLNNTNSKYIENNNSKETIQEKQLSW